MDNISNEMLQLCCRDVKKILIVVLTWHLHNESDLRHSYFLNNKKKVVMKFRIETFLREMNHTFMRTRNFNITAIFEDVNDQT